MSHCASLLLALRQKLHSTGTIHEVTAQLMMSARLSFWPVAVCSCVAQMASFILIKAPPQPQQSPQPVLSTLLFMYLPGPARQHPVALHNTS
uniref:Uncharacterized protein n=1 Tax=Gorilla gorilla gorilla TaxID=9595 RepID=A0A2I2Z5G4_GORGO